MALRNCPWQRLVGVWRTDASPSHFQEFMKRHVSGGYLYDASDADVADVIDSNLAKKRIRKEDLNPLQVLTTRREALSLYRDILRVTRAFVYPDNDGRLWRDVLRESARQEYEAARFEQDPEIINRLIVVGRDAVSQVTDKFIEKAKEATPVGAGPGHPPPYQR
ncbi:CPLD69 [Auxenochlorella protothecoides x Auxenochlorella symbiontica]